VNIQRAFIRADELPDSLIGCDIIDSTLDSLDSLPPRLKYFSRKWCNIFAQFANYLPYGLEYFTISSKFCHFNYLPLNLKTLICYVNYHTKTRISLANMPHLICKYIIPTGAVSEARFMRIMGPRFRHIPCTHRYHHHSHVKHFVKLIRKYAKEKYDVLARRYNGCILFE
jgi:hypothetical protein